MYEYIYCKISSSVRILKFNVLIAKKTKYSTYIHTYSTKNRYIFVVYCPTANTLQTEILFADGQYTMY